MNKEKIIPFGEPNNNVDSNQTNSPLSMKTSAQERRSTNIILQSFKAKIIINRNSNDDAANAEYDTNNKNARVLLPDADFQIIIETQDILARYLFGEKIGNRILQLYFMKSNSSKMLILIVEVLWWSATLIKFLFLFGVIQLDFNTMMIVGILNTLKAFLALFVSNMVILKILLQRFETLFLLTVLGLFLGSSIILFSQDARFIIFITWLPELTWTHFFDGFLHHTKKVAIWVGVFAGLVTLIVFLFGLIFKLIAVDEIPFSFGSFNMSLTEIVLHSGLTITFFCIKNFINFFLYPNCLSVLQCKLKNVVIDSTVADIFKEIGANKGKIDEEETVRIITPQVNLVEPFVASKTIGSLVGGKGFSNFVFKVLRRSTFIICITLIWIIGTIAAILSICNIYPRLTSGLSIFMLPTPILLVSLFSTKIAIKVLLSFQTIYSLYNSLVLTASIMVLWRESPLTYISLVSAMPSVTMMLGFDALPSSGRAKFSVVMIWVLNILAFVCFFTILFFKLGNITEFEVQAGYIHLSASGSAFHAISNLIIFGFKNLWNSVFSPDSLVVLSTRVEIIKVNKSWQTQLKAADLLKKEENVIIKKQKGEGNNSSSPSESLREKNIINNNKGI